MENLKDKIKFFSKGDFQIKRPEIIFPKTHLVLKIGEGEMYHGEFIIENQADGDIRGLVYPSSLRVKCREQGFEGNPVTVRFTYDGTDLQPGHVENGKFTVVCNGGEYHITFSAIIEKPFIETSIGKIQDLRGFKKLAFANFQEAQKIYRTRDFYELIKYDENKVKNLYHNMRKWNLDEQGLEEFLVGIKQKEKIFLTLEQVERVYKNIEEDAIDHLIIRKNTWGYLPVKVEVECDFIQLDKNRFTTHDFRGNEYEFPYTIISSKLHNGRNFGKIIFETFYRKLEYIVEVDMETELTEDRRYEAYTMAHLIKSYLRLEGGVIKRNRWLEQATKLITELQIADASNVEYKLLQAHAYLIAGLGEEAKWILENYNYNKFALGRNIELDSYYLFLTALQRRESSYTKKVVEELQKQYLKNSQSWKLLCMLIQIDPYYNDYYERKHALENQFNHGANQLVFYVEAYRCFSDKTSNLKKLGDFEIQILRFANKYKLMTRELALYTANLASQQKRFDERIFGILEDAYLQHKDSMILISICTILIKGNQTNKRYFKWYELAVKEELKIAKLFEYYMDSLDVDTFTKELPRTVLLYFAHGNNLSYEKAALLYANVVSLENDTSDFLQYYQEEIQVFTMQQLELRRINPQLRVIYRKLLSAHETNIEKIRAIDDISHSYLLTTRVPNIKAVMVIAGDGEIYQNVAYTSKGAQVILESRDDIIVWESNVGEHYIGSIKYETNRLFYELKFIDMCKKHSNRLNPENEEKEELILTYEKLCKLGMDRFDDASVFLLCKTKIRERDYEEDDYMTHFLFELFKREYYDKNTLKYLATYFCGATHDMKDIWFAANDYEVSTLELGERIITQMLFSESMFGEEEIFEEYYNGSPYFRLVEAYICYVSREYMVKEKVISEAIVKIIMTELIGETKLPDIVKMAILKYFSSSKLPVKYYKLLMRCMQELCEKQIYFQFYMNYDEDWLREVQLWDKTLVTYTSKIGGKVKIVYQLQKDGEKTHKSEVEMLLPMYEDVFVRKFMIFRDEVLKYYFVETLDDTTIKSKVKVCRIDREASYKGKYGRLNDIMKIPEFREEKMLEYAFEEVMADKIFVPYE